MGGAGGAGDAPRAGRCSRKAPGDLSRAGRRRGRRKHPVALGKLPFLRQRDARSRRRRTARRWRSTGGGNQTMEAWSLHMLALVLSRSKRASEAKAAARGGAHLFQGGRRRRRDHARPRRPVGVLPCSTTTFPVPAGCGARARHLQAITGTTLRRSPIPVRIARVSDSAPGAASRRLSNGSRRKALR
jgi:hypothetical protein